MPSAEFIELKAELLVNGVNATDKALEGLGTKYKEQNHGLFGWDFEDHPNVVLPDDFTLPDGTTVQFRRNSFSSYFIDLVDKNLILFNGKNEVCHVNWIPRPKFYDNKTNSNKEMVKIGQIGGEDCLFFCYQNFCSHFSRNEQCLFCNLVSTSDTYGATLKKKATTDIGEVAKAAFSDSKIKHILLTGGCFNHQKEIELVNEIVGTIRDYTGFNRVPGTILPSPAKTLTEIENYYSSGINAIGFSMEIWDEMLYRAICPGKSKSCSHDEFVNSIQNAVQVFGPGNVYGVLVMGLEPRESFLDGVRTLTNLGANVVPFVWSPNPGSKLEGHRAPTAKWYVDTILEAAQIVFDSKIPSGIENHCFKCDGNSLLHDALRLKGIE